MISKDDLEDVQELTEKIITNIIKSLEGHDAYICKSALCSSFSSIIYHYFDDFDQVKYFMESLVSGVAIISGLDAENNEEIK